MKIFGKDFRNILLKLCQYNIILREKILEIILGNIFKILPNRFQKFSKNVYKNLEISIFKNSCDHFLKFSFNSREILLETFKIFFEFLKNNFSKSLKFIQINFRNPFFGKGFRTFSNY